MRAAVLFFILCLGIFLASLYFSKENDISLPDPAQAAVKMEKSEKALDEFREAAREISVPREPTNPELSRDCTDQLQAILSFDWAPGDFAELPRLSACKEFPAQLRDLRDLYDAQCRMYFDVRTFVQSASVERECRRAMYNLRAGINDWQHREENSSEVHDPVLLFDRMMLGWNEGMAPEKISEIAERLHRLEPDLYEPVKVLVATKARQWLGAKSADDAQGMERELENLLDDAFSFGVEDPDLWNTLWMLRTRKMTDLSRADEVLDEMEGAGVFAAKRHLFRSYKNLKDGDKEGALDLLEMAQSADPKNEEIRSTRKMVEDTNFDNRENIPPFNISMDFNLDWFPPEAPKAASNVAENAIEAPESE